MWKMLNGLLDLFNNNGALDELERLNQAFMEPRQTWEIDKSFNFCYGHRVFSQVLNTEYTEVGHTCPKCRHIHGHEGLVKVFLEGEELNPQGMVEDFVNLGWVKNFLDDHLDHKFILSTEDPWFHNILNGTFGMIAPEMLAQQGVPVHGFLPIKPFNTTDMLYLPSEGVFVPGTNHFAGYELDVSSMSDGPEKEFYEGYFLVDFVPTSENLAKWLFDCIDAKMSLIDVRVSKISWNETPKSRAVYARQA